MGVSSTVVVFGSARICPFEHGCEGAGANTRPRLTPPNQSARRLKLPWPLPIGPLLRRSA